MSHESAKERMEEIAKRPDVRSVVLFTRNGKILKKSSNIENAQKIANATLALLQSLDETISKKYESQLTFQSLRVRGKKNGEGIYIYVIRGDESILTMLQKASISQEEKKILEEVQTIKEFFRM